MCMRTGCFGHCVMPASVATTIGYLSKLSSGRDEHWNHETSTHVKERRPRPHDRALMEQDGKELSTVHTISSHVFAHTNLLNI